MTTLRSYMTLQFQQARRHVTAHYRRHQVLAESFFLFSLSLFAYALLEGRHYAHQWHLRQQRLLLLDSNEKRRQQRGGLLEDNNYEEKEDDHDLSNDYDDDENDHRGQRRRQQQQQRHRRWTHHKLQPDAFYVRKAHALRQALSKPSQSNFRVVCGLILENGVDICWGANDEPTCCISGAMCAERAACGVYRTKRHTQAIVKIVIVSDADDTPLPPGTLCREYLFCHKATHAYHTHVILQSRHVDSPIQKLRLGDLYPYPSVYCGISAKDSVRLGTQLQASIREQCYSHLIIPKLSRAQTHILLDRAYQAATTLYRNKKKQQLQPQTNIYNDTDHTMMIHDHYRPHLHPIQYGAAAAVENTHTNALEYWSACQLKTVEYGASQDPVCQVVARAIYVNDDEVDAPTTTTTAPTTSAPQYRILALVQMDQFGIPHAPFAAARACLVEHVHCPHQLSIVVTFPLETSSGSSSSPTYSVCTVQATELNPHSLPALALH